MLLLLLLLPFVFALHAFWLSPVPLAATVSTCCASVRLSEDGDVRLQAWCWCVACCRVREVNRCPN